MSTDLTKELIAKIDAVRDHFRPVNTVIWRHFKGGIYKVIGYTIDSDTLDVLIRYTRIDGPGFDVRGPETKIEWSRPSVEWDDLVPDPAIPGQHTLRFAPVHKYEHYKTEAEADAFPSHRALING